MGAADVVNIQIAVQSSAGLPQEALSVGMIAAYHTHYPDRMRLYTSTTGMTADGFKSSDPVTRAAQLYWSENSSAQLAIGRRANAYSQILDLALTDTTVGDLYSFTAVGQDGTAHAVSVTSTGNPAVDALTIKGLFATNGSPVVATGTTPPTVTLTGTATANAVIEIDITTGGARGTALFTWKLNGTIQAVNVPTGASVALPGTGLQAAFTVGTYAVDNVYASTAIVNCGAVSVSGATVIFSQSAGQLTDIQGWTTNIQVTDATTDPGLSADLDAIKAANTLAWYMSGLDSNSAAEVKAAEGWVEGTGIGGKVGFFSNSDYADITGTATADVFSASQALSYKKSMLGFNGKSVLCYEGIGAMGYATTVNPGSYTFGFKDFSGVPQDDDTSLTETQRLVLNSMTTSSPGTGGKNGNYYVAIPGFWPGVTPSGQFMDLTIFIDWLYINVQSAVFAVLKSLPKVPLTDFGLGLIGDAIKGVLTLASGPDYNALDPTANVVVVPKAASLTKTQRAARNPTGFSFQCLYTGAAQTVTIKATVST